jgi:hypothetical protein
MHIEISTVLVEDHHRRLSEAAQTPMPSLLVRLWALIRRREQPAPVVSLPARDVERLAA